MNVVAVKTDAVVLVRVLLAVPRIALHAKALALRCFSDLGYIRGDFPISERASDETLALPIYPELSPDMLLAVCSAIH